MTHKKIWEGVPLFLFLFFGMDFISADALWDRVVANVEGGSQVASLDIIVNTTIYKGGGDISQKSETHIIREWNGKELAVNSIEKSGDRVQEGDALLENFTTSEFAQKGLFLRENQERLILEREETSVISGKNTVLYLFRFETPDRGLLSGKIWILEDTSLPLRLYSEPEKSRGAMDMESIDIFFHVEEGPDEWGPKEVTLKGEMGRISKRNIMIHMVMDDFWVIQ